MGRTARARYTSYLLVLRAFLRPTKSLTLRLAPPYPLPPPIASLVLCALYILYHRDVFVALSPVAAPAPATEHVTLRMSAIKQSYSTGRLSIVCAISTAPGPVRLAVLSYAPVPSALTL